ncbi:MAG: hypothetical protein QM473_06925 [Acidobacteriota bacterium]|nr:hypothetical protein [Acidobacteriota bacterium]
MSLPLNLFKAMRPKQWTKNLLLFAALLFAKEYAQADSVLRVVAAFVLFCILSGTV